MRRFFTFLLLLPVTLSLIAQDGLLWKISGNGLKKESYLFGTIHMICEEDLFIPDNLTIVFNKIDKLFLELDLTDPSILQAIMSKSMDPAMVEAYGEFEPEIAEKIDAMLNEALGVGFDQMKMMKPFALTSILSQSLLDCENKTAYETVFVDMAKQQENKVVIKGLETVDFQLGLFDSIPLEEQLQSLKELIREFEESRVFMKKMVEMYLKQDLKRLYRLIEEDKTFADLSDEFIVKRNATWIPVIEKNMKSGSCLFAVGAGHLPGEKGVIELLREKGYTVKAH